MFPVISDTSLLQLAFIVRMLLRNLACLPLSTKVILARLHGLLQEVSSTILPSHSQTPSSGTLERGPKKTKLKFLHLDNLKIY